ncbi:hypothetical protein CSPB_0180 [Campylobacter sputorum subsp. bovis]|nr:hypothetical protein CSPB_0180 [Campylobacter sputorum]
MYNKNKILIGEYNEKVICKQFIKLRLISLFNWLWGRSKNQGILLSTFRRSQGKSCRVQEAGEIQ